MNSDLMEKVTQEEETRYVCCSCGDCLDEDDILYFDGEYYCSDCLDEFTVLCSHCGERISESDAITDHNHTLCQDCYNDYYCSCETCGAIILNSSAYYMDDDNNDEYPYCRRCYESECNNRSIHDYGYKPEPVFHGTGTRYFGVELEVDEGGKDKYNADDILYIANFDDTDNLYIKSDGSLDDGMELVSHPMTLNYHKNTMPWERIMRRLIKMGYKSHKTETCGLHCHVNRDSLGNTIDEQEAVIARILYFVEHHWSEILRFSRRTESQMQRWANRYGMKNKPTEFLEDVKRRGYKRYACINLQNYHTIEFRFFRGTLKHNSFIAALQLVDEICNTAIFMSDEGMADLSWHDFVENLDSEFHKELITYLKERNLYINEPVESEDEE